MGKEAQISTDLTTDVTTAVQPPLGETVEPKQTQEPSTTVPKTTAPVVAPKPADDDDDDEAHPDDKGVVTLPLEAFKSRIKRATSAELRKLFGTADVAEITAMKKELDDHRASKEEARKKNLDEIARVKEEAAQERAARKAAEARADDLEQSQLASNEDVKIRAISDKYVSPKYYRVASRELRDWLLEEHGDEIEDVTYSQIEKWFKTYASENPEIGIVAEAEPKEEPINNGAKDSRPEVPTSGKGSGKTAAPGQPNSMSKQEFTQYKRERGWTF